MSIDHVTYWFVYLSLTWSILFLVQLVPYIGYVATVIQLMVKDTLIFLLFGIAFAIPYVNLFSRIINHNKPLSECDSKWDKYISTAYSSFLLLFNMMNFEAKINDNAITEEATQLKVSIKYLSENLLIENSEKPFLISHKIIFLRLSRSKPPQQLAAKERTLTKEP